MLLVFKLLTWICVAAKDILGHAAVNREYTEIWLLFWNFPILIMEDRNVWICAEIICEGVIAAQTHAQHTHSRSCCVIRLNMMFPMIISRAQPPSILSLQSLRVCVCFYVAWYHFHHHNHYVCFQKEKEEKKNALIRYSCQFSMKIIFIIIIIFVISVVS